MPGKRNGTPVGRTVANVQKPHVKEGRRKQQRRGRRGPLQSRQGGPNRRCERTAEQQQTQAVRVIDREAGRHERGRRPTVLVRGRGNHWREWMADVVQTEPQRSAGRTASQLVTGSGSRVEATAVEERFVDEN
jgi:hypothetical protein